LSRSTYLHSNPCRTSFGPFQVPILFDYSFPNWSCSHLCCEDMTVRIKFRFGSCAAIWVLDLDARANTVLLITVVLSGLFGNICLHCKHFSTRSSYHPNPLLWVFPFFCAKPFSLILYYSIVDIFSYFMDFLKILYNLLFYLIYWLDFCLLLHYLCMF